MICDKCNKIVDALWIKDELELRCHDCRGTTVRDGYLLTEDRIYKVKEWIDNEQIIVIDVIIILEET